jgi:hypothetical protein
MKHETQIFSIFGEIEAIAANAMGFERIEFDDIPPTARYNDQGKPAKFAVIVPGRAVAEFERRIALLRA